ncbi:serine hydrolase, partial [Lysobacter sp. 2RAB21]
VMEGATGTNLANYLSTRLWSRMGAEADATWWSESPDGMTVSGSGMHATMRDYARFGQFVLDGGRIGAETLLPEGWTGEAGQPF